MERAFPVPKYQPLDVLSASLRKPVPGSKHRDMKENRVMPRVLALPARVEYLAVHNLNRGVVMNPEAAHKVVMGGRAKDSDDALDTTCVIYCWRAGLRGVLGVNVAAGRRTKVLKPP